MPWKNETENLPSETRPPPGTRGGRKHGCLLAGFPVLIYLVAVVAISAAFISDFEASGANCTTSTAGLAYFFIPIYATIPAIPFAVLAYALSAIIGKRGDPSRSLSTLALAAIAVSVVYVAYLGIGFAGHHRLASLVKHIRTMSDAELSAFLDTNPAPLNHHVLTAIALNRDAGADTLARVAQIEAPGVHLRDDSSPIDSKLEFLLRGWVAASGGRDRTLRGQNQHWRLSVHELVALHPNVSAPTLARLAACPNAYTVANVAMNARTTPETLEAIRTTMDQRNEPLSFRQQLCDRPARVNAAYAIRLRLAENPRLPVSIQQSLLEGSEDACLAAAIASNPGAAPATRTRACEIVGAHRRGCEDFSLPNWLHANSGRRSSDPADACHGR